MRKNLKSFLLLLTMMTAMWILGGCGDGQQVNDVPRVEQANEPPDQLVNMDDVTEEENNPNEETDTEDNYEDEPIQGESVGESSDEPTSEPQDADTSTSSTEELSVYVDSIGDNSVVGDKIFIEPGLVEGSEIAVVGSGGDNKALLTVYFDDNASYIYRIIRDGGANVETYDGSFSDIKEGFILNMTGRYEGEDFRAEEVEIHDVRND